MCVCACVHVCAHFNPAVSLAFWMRREITARDAGAYALVQCLGGIAGVMAAHLMFELPLLQASTTVRAGVGQWSAEFIATSAEHVHIQGACQALERDYGAIEIPSREGGRHG